jgi:hypothetical protein
VIKSSLALKTIWLITEPNENGKNLFQAITFSCILLLGQFTFLKSLSKQKRILNLNVLAEGIL